jgi:hypothetical protein
MKSSWWSRSRSRVALSLVAWLSGVLAVAGLSCASIGHTSDFDAGASYDASLIGRDGEGALLGDGGTVFIEDASNGPDSVSTFTGPLPGPFADFPATPVLDMPDGGGGAAPASSPQLFGPASQGAQSGGPCLVEPEIGALYPNNWLRPRFAWTTANSESLYELRVHADNQTNDLVVYTTQMQWTMPQTMWAALSADSQDVPMTVSIRGGLLNGGGPTPTLQGEALGSSGAIGIAPVGAPGTIVYWAVIDGSTGLLKGFHVGDESVVTVLDPSQVQERGGDGGLPCIGCHASTPDGLNVGFSIGYTEGTPGAYTDSIATLGIDATPGLVPSFLSADGKVAMDALGGIPAYSAAHWSAAERLVLLSDTGQDLNWVNLQGTGAQAAGVVARGSADKGLVTDPTWSHDGNTIVYTSAQSVYNGRQNGGPMDLYTVPYASGAGGQADPIAGASLTGVDEYYPSFSPDDAYVVFTSGPTGDNPYSDPKAQIFIVPASGAPSGQPLRPMANDPPACTQHTSPGVTNSWAKWSPSAQNVPVLHDTYYWIVFSSTRYPSGPAQGSPQLYITAVVVDAQGKMTTYGSLYLWNQPPSEHNHTPAWDYFQIPPVPPPLLQ